MGVEYDLAEYASKLKFDDIPSDVIHQTKRLILDTLGCALGGHKSETSQILREVIEDSNHPGEATVFVNGNKTSTGLAALVNGAMVRYLDYNDTAFIIQGDTYRSGYHPSEVIPGILAFAECNKVKPRDVITAINIGYDLSLAWLEGVIGSGIEKYGFNGDTRGVYVMPLVFGRMLGLEPKQIVNAIGIAGSCHTVFGILDSPSEEYTMTKNIRFPAMVQASLQAIKLAQKGFTGPQEMIEGSGGLIETIMRGEYDLTKLRSGLGKWSIMNTCIKTIIADFSSHGHLSATLKLANEYDINIDDVDKINIRTSKRCAEHTGDPIKKYPKNKETADHSSYWLTAIAIKDRQIGPNQFYYENYTDPKVNELIGRIEMNGDPSLDKLRPAGESTIVTKSGKEYSAFVDYPRGHAKNPMTDDEVISKFKDVASEYLSNDKVDNLLNIVFSLEETDDISNLVNLMVSGKL